MTASERGGVEDAIWKALHVNSDRITELEGIVSTRNELMRDAIKSAVQDAMPKALLSDDEHTWVRMAIQREAQMASFRRAVIEKTMLGLIWAGIVGLALMLREYAIAHGMWRP